MTGRSALLGIFLAGFAAWLLLGDWAGLLALAAALALLVGWSAGRRPEPEPEDRPHVRQSGEEGLEVWRLPLEDSLDLHTFAPRDVADVSNEYLREASRAGLPEVRLIHGKGTGAQRAQIRRLLQGHPLVESYSDAPPERGGWGATVVRLKPPGEG